MIAWERYKLTEDYKNTRKWALDEQHVDGSLWAAFAQGFQESRSLGDSTVLSTGMMKGGLNKKPTTPPPPPPKGEGVPDMESGGEDIFGPFQRDVLLTFLGYLKRENILSRSVLEDVVDEYMQKTEEKP